MGESIKVYLKIFRYNLCFEKVTVLRTCITNGGGGGDDDGNNNNSNAGGYPEV
jgi:hypothetical protein